MASLEARLEAVIGPRPEERTWCDEWVPLWLERARLEGKVYEWPVPPEYLLQAGGSDSVMTSQRDQASAIDSVVALGWKRPLAMAFTLLNNLFAAPLAAAVAERSPRYAAATHMICTALAQGAAKQQAAAPLCYKNLEGPGGLASTDPAWQALLTGAGLGTSLVTNGTASGWSDARTFPEEGGVFHNCVFRGGTWPPTATLDDGPCGTWWSSSSSTASCASWRRLDLRARLFPRANSNAPSL